MVGGLEFLLFPIVVLGLLGMGVAAVLGSRREEDPLGRRPYTIYLSAVSFIALFVLLFAFFSAMSAVGKVAFTEGTSFPDGCFSGPGFSECVSMGSGVSSSSVPVLEESGGLVSPDFIDGPNHRQDIRTIVQQVATGLVALLVLLFHLRRLRSVTQEPTFSGSAAERTYLNYMYAVCFAAILVALSAGGAFLFAAFRAIAPGTIASGPGIDPERDDALVQLLSSGALTAASLWLFRKKWTAIEGRTESLAPSGTPEAT